MKSEDEVGSLIEYEFRVSSSSWSFYYTYRKLTCMICGLEYVIFVILIRMINAQFKVSLPVCKQHTGFW